MTTFTDITLQAVKLAISLRQVARVRPDATIDEPMSSHYTQHWKLTDMADRLSAIHLVMGIIAETPNAHINREALDGLKDQFKLAIDFLETPLANEAIAEADRRFFES